MKAIDARARTQVKNILFETDCSRLRPQPSPMSKEYPARIVDFAGCDVG
jgi:hypothetical protein